MLSISNRFNQLKFGNTINELSLFLKYKLTNQIELVLNIFSKLIDNNEYHCQKAIELSLSAIEIPRFFHKILNLKISCAAWQADKWFNDSSKYLMQSKGNEMGSMPTLFPTFQL